MANALQIAPVSAFSMWSRIDLCPLFPGSCDNPLFGVPGGRLYDHRFVGEFFNQCDNAPIEMYPSEPGDSWRNWKIQFLGPLPRLHLDKIYKLVN